MASSPTGGRGSNQYQQKGAPRSAATQQSTGAVAAAVAAIPPILPPLSVNNGKDACQRIHDALEAAGLPRTSRLSGGEIRGVTTAEGSTGFSARVLSDGTIDWHIVISGKAAGIKYRDYTDWQGDEQYEMSDPINPDVVIPRIREVFSQLGLQVIDRPETPQQLSRPRCTGWQSHWDDDIDYNVLTAAYD